jgi:hypothetical protein
MVISSSTDGITAITIRDTQSGVEVKSESRPVTGFSKKIIDNAESIIIAGWIKRHIKIINTAFIRVMGLNESSFFGLTVRPYISSGGIKQNNCVMTIKLAKP